MIRHQHLYSLIFFLLSCLPLSAQQIKGTITDGETGETIPYASVVYKGHHVAVISDIDGARLPANWTLFCNLTDSS